jgi:hypothetical protein
MAIFTSKVRSAGDLAGVFEYDGETGYFYLYDQRRERGQMVFDAIQVVSSVADFQEPDVQVVWDATETRVALVIRHRVWALFDTRTEASTAATTARMECRLFQKKSSRLLTHR